MGTDPSTDDYEPGIQCPLCKDVLFDGITPKYVEADIFGIIQCPGKPAVPTNGTCLLTQTFACRWFGLYEGWDVTWNLAGLASGLDISQVLLRAFVGFVADDCIDAFVNVQVDCVAPFNCGRDGYVTLWWGPTIGP